MSEGLGEGVLRPERVVGSIEQGTLLISFFCAKPRDGAGLLNAFVATSDGIVGKVTLGSAEEIEALVLHWRDLLSASSVRGIAVSGGGEEKAGADLRRRLIDPCLALAHERPARLRIVPDDFLFLAPLDALPSDDGRRLDEVFDIRFGTAAAHLVQAVRPVAGGTLVVVGAIDYDTEPTVDPVRAVGASVSRAGARFLSAAAVRFEELPGSSSEIDWIRGSWNERFDLEPTVPAERRRRRWR